MTSNVSDDNANCIKDATQMILSTDTAGIADDAFRNCSARGTAAVPCIVKL